MTEYSELPDACVAAAVELRARLRALAAGQTEAFGLISQEIGGTSQIGMTADRMATRLPFLAFLLADLAWTHGERSAHDETPPERAVEVDSVCRVFRRNTSERRRYAMNAEQRSAVLTYLDATLLEVGRCIDLEGHAPSPRLGREAREFVSAVSELRRVAAVPPAS
jgi:hypothetical protein